MHKWCLSLVLLPIGLAWQEARCQQPAGIGLDFAECSDEEIGTRQDLGMLWQLTLASNPQLREAQADVDAARGQTVQAGKYPNPRFTYLEDTIGSRIAAAGDETMTISQELVTAGKRQLDKAMAARNTNALLFAQTGQHFDVLTKVRRAYYVYLGLNATARINDEAVDRLEKGVASTRKLVEAGKPITDLLRLQALLEEMKISQTRAHINAQWAWRQLAAEVGVNEIPFMPLAHDLDRTVPNWNADELIDRVLARHSALREREQAVERARLGVKRARAEAIPNVNVTGGYTNDAMDQTAGWIIGLEVPLPIWDRKQGLIQTAQARLAHAQASVQSTANLLRRETFEALARYQTVRQQVDRLEREVLPLLKKSFDVLEKNYQGGGQVAFSDLLMTEQSYFSTRLTLAAARQNLWLAIADVQGLLQQGLE